MSDAEWDADDFEPPSADLAQPAATVADATTAATATDKWEGEDEEDDIKDNWDDEGADNDKVNGMDAIPRKKKKSLAERIAEKEAKKKADAEEKRRLEEEAKLKMTPEEIAEEKLRQQKIVEESDLELAADTFGISRDELSGNSIDGCSPSCKEDFDKFAELLKTKISRYDKSPHFSSFLDTMFRDLAVSLEIDDIKKLASTLNTLANEKQKQSKTKGKKKGKAKVNAGRDNDYEDYTVTGLDDFDDFM